MAKILLVDDAKFMRIVLKNALTKGGFGDCEFFEASNGEEGVKVYEEKKPDLVIMDITMPVMDGLEALKIIRENHKDANVIMCTAMGQETILADAIRFGARDFVVKPFDEEKILASVKAILK